MCDLNRVRSRKVGALAMWQRSTPPRLVPEHSLEGSMAGGGG